MLNIILTSYNRPALLRRTLDSLYCQTSQDFRVYLQDDGSNKQTRRVIDEYKDAFALTICNHAPSIDDRAGTTRYSVLINEILPTLTAGVVGYLCDNVEYHPYLVEVVLAWFERNPNRFSGYVTHRRDVFSADGRQRVGAAGDFGHWDELPPVPGPIHSPDGLLDHSQVFHRLPIDLRWSEDPTHKARGDGEFFTRLAAEYGPIYQIHQTRMTTEHLLEDRV